MEKKIIDWLKLGSIVDYTVSELYEMFNGNVSYDYFKKVAYEYISNLKEVI